MGGRLRFRSLVGWRVSKRFAREAESHPISVDPVVTASKVG